MALGSDISESKQIVESVDNNNCCICLEPLAKRTNVKLQCSHQYHLDCIGSAFNAKNEMQCPTCRQVEEGEWLYAQPQPQPNPLVPDFNFDDWVLEPEQDPLQLSLNMWIQPNMGLHGVQVRRETVLPNMFPNPHSYLDNMFPNSNRQHIPQFHAPNEISEVFMTYNAAGRVNPLETRRLQYQLRNNWHANQRRLTGMSHMQYGFGGSGGGFSHGGASSSGGNGDWEEADFANGGGTNRRGRCICGFCDL